MKPNYTDKYIFFSRQKKNEKGENTCKTLKVTSHMVCNYKLRRGKGQKQLIFYVRKCPLTLLKEIPSSAEREKLTAFMKRTLTTVGEDAGQSELTHSSSKAKQQSLWKQSNNKPLHVTKHDGSRI